MLFYVVGERMRCGRKDAVLNLKRWKPFFTGRRGCRYGRNYHATIKTYLRLNLSISLLMQAAHVKKYHTADRSLSPVPIERVKQQNHPPSLTHKEDAQAAISSSYSA